MPQHQPVIPGGISEGKALSLSDAELIASKMTLPCGRVVPNRLVKAAMYEHLADFGGGPPNACHLSLYSRWARGGWGMIITGNCQISRSHLTLGRDMTYQSYNTTENLEAFKAISTAIHAGSDDSDNSHGTLAIMQLSHSGRQSPRFIGGRIGTKQLPLSPSSRRVGDDTKEGWLARLTYKTLFQTPLAMSLHEIAEVIDGFVHAAQMSLQAGFDGVQIHASHGYLLSQFLSPKLNTRTDEYSEPLQLIRKIITRIRALVPSTFVLGIKLNAGDYVTGGLSEEQALEHVKEIALLGVDFIEISGGSYENPSFVAPASPRQAFFSSFSRLVVKSLPASDHSSTPLIMLTGALRTPSQFTEILRQRHADLLGLARMSVLCPNLPRLISPTSDSQFLDGPDREMFPLPEPQLYNPRWFPKLLGAGFETAWYVVGIRKLAENKEIDLGMGSLGALFRMWFWKRPHN